MRTREETEELVAKCTVHNNYEIAGFFNEYRWLSNHYLVPIQTGPVGLSLIFPSNEHAFMYRKLGVEDKNYVEYKKIIEMTSAQVKAWGKTIKLRPDWDKVKKKIMFDINYSKFAQHPDLKEKLLATGKKNLEERNYFKDSYWGTAESWNDMNYKFEFAGQNWLGKILMMVRDLV